MSSADKSVVSGVLLSKTSRAVSRTSNDRNWMSDSTFAYKKIPCALTGTFFMHVQKKCWSEKNWTKFHNPTGFLIFFQMVPSFHFFFFFDRFHKFTPGPPIMPSPKPSQLVLALNNALLFFQ